VFFTLAFTAAKVRELDITSSCFGHASKHWSFPHLATNLAILAALIAVSLKATPEKRSVSYFRRRKLVILSSYLDAARHSRTRCRVAVGGCQALFRTRRRRPQRGWNF